MHTSVSSFSGLRSSPRKGFAALALVAVCALLASVSAFGATYSWNSSSSTRKLVLNIPDNVDAGVVRGIIIHGNGAGGDDTSYASDPELVAFAESIGFAVLATGNWGKFDIGSNGLSSEFTTLTNRIAAFATQSGHPELVHAPWIAEGHSNGGQMAYGLNVLAPSKMIGFVVNKGQHYNDRTPTAEALKTPAIFIAGENDSPERRNSIKTLFETNRAFGALWAWVEEENIVHGVGQSYKLIRPFLAECVKLRYPANASPVDGPVTLIDLEEEEGWIVNQNTWTSGLTDVHAYANETGDPLEFGWVPNQRVAYLYRAFSTYNKAAGAVGGSGAAVTDPLPATLTFYVNMSGQSWSKVEFYEGGTKIAEAFPSGGNSPATSHAASTGGYYVFHAIVTKTNSSLSSTDLRPVYVSEPLVYDEEPGEELKVLIDFGPSGTTTTGGDDALNTWNNITSQSLNTPVNLVGSTGAASGIALTLTDSFTGNQNTGTTSPTSYVTDAARDSFYFDYGRTPQLKFIGLNPAQVYDLKFFGSRMTSDSLVRSTLFTVQGFGSAVAVVNNATNNTGTIVEANGILPSNTGEIVIDLEENLAAPLVNDTNSGVGYLGILEITTAAAP